LILAQSILKAKTEVKVALTFKLQKYIAAKITVILLNNLIKMTIYEI
jgi:hypothetical protein